MQTKKLLYIDMDDVLCDYTSAYQVIKDEQPEIEFPQSLPGFFENLTPKANAAVSFIILAGSYDVHILSAPSVYNPLSYTEKRIWVEKHLGFEFTHKLILATNKGLLKGDYLVDDYASGRGQENFEGELLHFGSEQYPDWNSITAYLL